MQIEKTLQNPAEFQRLWIIPFNDVVNSIIQPQIVQTTHQNYIPDNDYFDDEDLNEVINDEEFNPNFTINQSLLDEVVYPVEHHSPRSL